MLQDFLFEDDYVLNTGSEVEMPLHAWIISLPFVLIWARLLTPNRGSPPVTSIPSICEPLFRVNGEILNALNKFTYLDSILSKNVHIEDEVEAQIAKPVQHIGGSKRK